jgi:hypothetical protein
MNIGNEEEIEEIEMVSKYERGSRTLPSNDIQYLRSTIREIYDSILSFEIMGEATEEIVEMLIDNDISFQTTLAIFENIYPERNGEIQPIIETNYISFSKQERIKERENKPSLSVILSSGTDSYLEPKVAKRIEKEIEDKIQYNPLKDMVVAITGTNTRYVNNNIMNHITYHHVRILNDQDLSKENRVIKVCLKGLTVYNNPLNEDPRLFKAEFITAINKPLELGPSMISEIYDFLNDSGYVIGSKYGKDALPAIFNQFIEEDKATIKNEIDYPGFFWDKNTKKLITIDYPLTEPSAKELKDSLNLLEEFAECHEEKIKLAHILKWGLISPFSFAIKQRGKWINHLFLYGKAGSGKTTLADMVLYLWNTPNSDTNDIGGSSFNTEARIGERLKKFTFPIVVNEPQGVFEKPGIVEMLKSSIERTNSRGKFVGRGYKNILSLSPVIYTSNHILPDDDALIRRIDCLSFTHNERKTEQQKESFRKKFNTENRNECLLHGLKPLAQYFAQEIIQNPSYLDENWKELTNTLITRLYSDIGQEPPSWLLGWSKTETLEDMDDLQIERIRIFLQLEINKAYGQIQIIDEDGRPQKDYKDEINLKTTDDFKHRLWYVLNERKIPYLTLTKQNNIQITRGFNDTLKKETGINESLKSIGELLGWKYGPMKVGGSTKSTKVISTSFDEFLNFVFP